jgi:hypothetical protein
MSVIQIQGGPLGGFEGRLNRIFSMLGLGGLKKGGRNSILDSPLTARGAIIE